MDIQGRETWAAGEWSLDALGSVVLDNRCRRLASIVRRNRDKTIENRARHVPVSGCPDFAENNDDF